MITCEICKDLIEQYLEGTITDERLDELREHTQSCDSCREEFERCGLVGDVVRAAFRAGASAEQGREAILGRLGEQPMPIRRIRPDWTRRAAAAAVLLAGGLVIGFAVGRSDSGVELAEKVRAVKIDNSIEPFNVFKPFRKR